MTNKSKNYNPETSSNCPICNEKLKECTYYEEYWGNSVVSENYKECLCCKKYLYEYFYGNSKVIINKKYFIWNYKDEDENIIKINNRINKKIKIERKANL